METTGTYHYEAHRDKVAEPCVAICTALRAAGRCSGEMPRACCWCTTQTNLSSSRSWRDGQSMALLLATLYDELLCKGYTAYRFLSAHNSSLEGATKLKPETCTILLLLGCPFRWHSFLKLFFGPPIIKPWRPENEIFDFRQKRFNRKEHLKSRTAQILNFTLSMSVKKS